MANVSVNTNSSQSLYNTWQEKLKAKQAKEQKINKTNTELTAAQTNIDIKSTAKASAEEVVSTATQNVTTEIMNYNNIAQQWNFANTQLQTLASRCAQDPDNESLKAQYETAKANVETIKANLENAKAKVEEAQVQQQNAEKELEAVTKELEAAEEKHKTIEENLAKLNEELTTLDSEITGAEADYEAAKAEEAAALAAAENSDKAQLTEAEAVEQGYTVIKTAQELAAIANNLSGKYILMADIDLAETNWTPIGNNENPFEGVLNGNGYSIKNLNINVTDDDAQNIGFFGVTQNATITNIDFEDAKVTTPTDFVGGASSVGIVAGLARGTTFDNINITGEVSGYESTGGLVGTLNDNSYYKHDGDELILVEVGNSSISNVATDVNANGKYYVGGLIGSIIDTSTAEGVATRDLKISNCNTSGNIVFDEEAAGGLIGQSGKTIITVNNCTSNANITWNNDENDGDLSFLMETGRAGGIVGCVDGSYIAICNSEYNGNLNVDGDFKSNTYGWYMNDAQVSIYDLPAGLPIDDILNIDGIDALTPIVDAQTGIGHYEVTVSTLTGLDKIVSMIQAQPALAELVTFNVNFDFEAMDGQYDPSVYSQYGIVQTLHEDEDGNVCNDVYIDNEIDLETTYHGNNYSESTTEDTEYKLKNTMVSGLYKDENNNYVVGTDDGYKQVNMNFNYSSQKTNVTKRLDTDEVKYREKINAMVSYYQSKMRAIIKALFSIGNDTEVPLISKAEYKKLIKKQEAGIELTDVQKAAIATYQLDTDIMNKVAETTHNEGCGMGGNASFLDKTTTVILQDEDGRVRYTTMSGVELRQSQDEEGNLLFDDDGEPIYENLDGSEYMGLEEVYPKRAYPKTDESGNLLYSDEEGKSLTETTNENGEKVYTYEDGSVFEGDTETLSQQLEDYNIGSEYKNLQDEMTNMLQEVEDGKYPLDKEEKVVS